MSKKKKQKQSEREVEREIVRYLRDHPAFFENHLDLLADMTLPHETGHAVSLIERQVSVLRDQRDEARRKLQHLVYTAQKNEELSHHINTLILALLDSTSLEEMLEVVRNRLADDLDAEAVVVRLFDTGHATMRALPELVDWSEPVLGAFEKVIAGRRPVCGSLKPGQLDALFSGQSDNIASAALIPLVESTSSQRCYGLLAIGSPDRSRFRADMGTVFLSQLGKVLTRVLKMHLA